MTSSNCKLTTGYMAHLLLSKDWADCLQASFQKDNIKSKTRCYCNKSDDCGNRHATVLYSNIVRDHEGHLSNTYKLQVVLSFVTMSCTRLWPIRCDQWYIVMPQVSSVKTRHRSQKEHWKSGISQRTRFTTVVHNKYTN